MEYQLSYNCDNVHDAEDHEISIFQDFHLMFHKSQNSSFDEEENFLYNSNK